jgi:branched-chain amino acid transport system substrate-binding protein
MITITQRIGTYRIVAENLTRILVMIATALLCLPSQVWADEHLRVGVLLSLSGPRQQEGSEALRTIRMSHRLRPAALGRPVKLVIADAQSDPAQAACAMFRLIEREHVSAVIGDFMSSTSMAAYHIAERKRVPMLAAVCTVHLTKEDPRYFFPVRGGCIEEALQAAELCRVQFGAQTAVVVTDMAQELSIELAEAFKRAFAGMGGRILANVRIRTGQIAFGDTLSWIVDTKPDVVYAPVFGAECILLAKQSRNLGLSMPIVAGSNARCIRSAEPASHALEGIYIFSSRQLYMAVASANRASPMSSDHETANASGTAAGMVADAYFMLLDAVEKAGSVEPEAIRDAIANMRRPR